MPLTGAGATDPNAAGRSRARLDTLNLEAVRLARAGDHEAAVQVLTTLFAQAALHNLTHSDLHTCYSNRAASLLQLGRFNEALADADKAVQLVKLALPGGQHKYHPIHVKSLTRRGQALLGLGCFRDALHCFEEVLQLDPDNISAKGGVERAEQTVLLEALQGRNLERRALPAPDRDLRIAFLPHSTPVHRIRSKDGLPSKLLTPFQAERDHHTKDIYNYVTVQADIRLPARYLDQYLADGCRMRLMEEAVVAAVHDVRSRGLDCRVLVLGAGAGLMALVALRAGAYHVTCVERWLYLAQACREVLLGNGAEEDSFSVLCKRPCDVTTAEVPCGCNLVVCDLLLDDGLLSSGLLPAISHALQHLALPDSIVIPASVTVKAQALQIEAAGAPGGISLAGLDRHRWLPGPAPCRPPNPQRPPACTSAQQQQQPGLAHQGPRTYALSDEYECWHFDLRSPPDSGERKHVDVEFDYDGRWNACAFWGSITLFDHITLDTGFHSPLTSLQPSIQYLAGALSVHQGAVLPLLTSHNTIALRFDLEEGEYQFLHHQDASLPPQHLGIAADADWLHAYQQAISAAVEKSRQAGEEVVALDLGCGSGALSLMAATAGARSVVAVDAHESLCKVARKNVALNGLGSRISVVQADTSLLQRGQHVPPAGVNLVMFDLFDAGLLGGNCMPLLRRALQQVARPGAQVLPQSATVYAMGLQVLTSHVLGFDFSPLNSFRWAKTYSAVQLGVLSQHRALSEPQAVLLVDFAQGTVTRLGAEPEEPQEQEQVRSGLPGKEGEEVEGQAPGHPAARPVQPDVPMNITDAGVLNAVVFWFDLHLDGITSVTSAPPGYGLGGTRLPDPGADQAEAHGAQTGGHPARHRAVHLGQALQMLDHALPVRPGHVVPLIVNVGASGISFALPDELGMPVPKSPWLLEWGGGASIENPHRQRVLYCELLIKDLLQRLPGSRAPSVEEDLKVMLAHCGSLYLDPRVLAEVYHELCLLERLFSIPHR